MSPNGQPPAHAGVDEAKLLYAMENDFYGCTEKLENYKLGGLHPIILGDRLGDNGRFRVVHKLGHGGYGTVWLCQDTLFPTPKWRAVKVMSATASEPDCDELRAMEAFRDIERSTVENDFHISIALEHFWIDGPNGRHLALVFALSAITVNSMSSHYAQHRTLVKDLCFQLAKSLEFIHSRGLCHGDFRPDNILVRLCPGVDSLPEETLRKSFLNGYKPRTVRIVSEKDKKPITRASAPSVPEHLVDSTSIGFHSGLCAASLAVTDFGVSYSALNPPEEGCTGITLPYASPEERFRQRALLGPASDIWALGCCITKLALGFTPFVNEYEGDDVDLHAAKMEELMGLMTEPFRTAYKEEHKRRPKSRCFAADVAMSEDESNHDKREQKFITEIPSPYPKEVLEKIKKEEDAERDERAKRGERVMSPGQETFRRNLQRTIYLSVTQEEADGMNKQYELWRSQEKHPDSNKLGSIVQLPFVEARRDGKKVVDEDDEEEEDGHIEFRLDDKEADQLFELLMSIFKWHPKDRATLQQVLNHPWFERRNQHAAKVPPPITTGNKCVVGETPGWVKSLLNHRSAARLLPGGFS
ncbi:serine/threonine protein kinase [Pseudoneurospora amorphoporcata]|uniref:EKC/KEOPS complex subunit BUD32 n=1 Tax=Pseudoneurospora amorphoporcata TaxID=241081 RepID=A0AAN6NT99_9PEZI|nr:serine/threonine protein kinase [Pseudoneurospora amorphoporcata]